MSRSGQIVAGLPYLDLAHKINGTVKFFNVDRGFGKITRSDTGEEVFAHRTAIAVKNPNHADASLAEGEAVLMDVVEGQKGMEASNITGPQGGPVQGNEQAANGGGGYGGGGRSFGGGRGGGGYGGGGGGGGDGCFKCGQPGHFSRECPQGGGGYGGGGGRGGGGGSGCYSCGQPGHFSRECPNGGGGGGRY